MPHLWIVYDTTYYNKSPTYSTTIIISTKWQTKNNPHGKEKVGFFNFDIFFLYFILNDRLRGSNSEAPAAQTSSAIKVDNTSSTQDGTVPYKKAVQTFFLIMNLGTAFFMAATGALGVGSADSINDTGNIFVGIYMVLFAAIMFLFEIAQFCPGSSAEVIIKRNFGFLYGTIGKSLYILL